MYTFVVKSTIEASDRFEDFKPGDIVHQGEANRQFDSEAAAIRAGERVLRILGGGRAFNKVRASAEIVAIEVGIGSDNNSETAPSNDQSNETVSHQFAGVKS